MRISDWSSDVCSSDLNVEALGYFHLLLRQAGATQIPEGYELNGRSIRVINGAEAVLGSLRTKFIEPPVAVTSEIVVAVGATDRSEERRVGKECVSTCRSRWST